MRDDLLHYYERELVYLRRTGAEFAKRYPKVASRLQLEATKCDDPHVERLLEGFAFLAARIHLRIEDDAPELGEALLGLLYPDYVRPVPSLSLIQIELDPEQGKLTTGLRIPRGTALHSRPVGGAPCRFRTCYDTTLWPFDVVDAAWVAPHELRPPVRDADAVAALRVELRCLPDVTFDAIEIDTLRLHLAAEGRLAGALYELLLNSCVGVLVRETGAGAKREPITLPASALRPVGFEPDESLLPPPRRSFVGYRLLQEYFAFPQKFDFVDLTGLERLRGSGFGGSVELVFLIRSFEQADRRSMLEAGVSAETIRLGCTPVVNLFPRTSEPILLDQRQREYVVVPDARRRESTEVFGVEEVVAVTPGSAEPLHFEPLYSFRHGERRDAPRPYYFTRRRPRHWRPDDGTDLHLSFVDASGRTVYPNHDAVTVRLLCHNGDLPARLPFGDPSGDFEMAGGGPIRRVVALVKPTSVVHPPIGKPLLWRLVSLLSLNYVSLVEAGAQSLRELLHLHNAGDSAAGDRQIAGLVDVSTGPCYSRIDSDQGLTFARGHRVEIEFDEEEFAGGGIYLMASVLERFLALYTSLNSFSILAVRSRQRKRLVREWPPRAGWKTLL